ncbi:MAG: iron-sulfur flavoprotein, partial [Candidatus Thorarchaeota archaeon]
VLISAGGWWEKENMSLLVDFVDHMAKDASVEFSGSLLRPHAFLMTKYKEKADEILEAAKVAGVQLIKEGKVSRDTLDVISQPLESEKELREYYNDMYHQAKESSS